MRAYLSMYISVIPTDVKDRYQILSDPDKRRIYDQRGEAGLSESGGMGGMDPQVRVWASKTTRVRIALINASY